MKANGITPPVNYGQNGGYSDSCASSFSGPQEKDAYWYHTDHLGSSSFVTGLDGEVNQNIEYFPSGEVFVENHRNSYNTPYKFNGKELDDETDYYYGARYYNPRVSLWLNTDPLAEKMPSWSPYAYAFDNPIKFIDPDGRESKQVDDIRFRDKDGNLIATYHTKKIEKDVYIKNVNIKKDININLNQITDKLPDTDVIGINLSGEFTVVAGANLGIQFAYFLDGKDKGNGAFFYSAQGTLGISVGGGVSVFAGDFTGRAGDSHMTMNDFLGNTQSYNVGIEAYAGNYWWGNNLNKNQPELWPGMGSIYESKNRESDKSFKYDQTWRGISFGGTSGPPQLKGGASVGFGVTKYLKWANKLFQTAPYTKGYQK